MLESLTDLMQFRSTEKKHRTVMMALSSSTVLELYTLIVTGRMPRSGKLPVLFLLTGQKSGFSPRRGDSLHRFRSNFVRLTGTWVRLVVQNFMSIGAEGWECGPQNIKNFHFLLNSRPAGATPLTDFQFFRGFYTPNYPTLVF